MHIVITDVIMRQIYNDDTGLKSRSSKDACDEDNFEIIALQVLCCVADTDRNMQYDIDMMRFMLGLL